MMVMVWLSLCTPHYVVYFVVVVVCDGGVCDVCVCMCV